MAMKEVDLKAEAPTGGQYFKFTAIGDQLGGRYVGHKEHRNNFNKLEQQYTFKTREGSLTVAANYDLNRRLMKAIEDGLKPGMMVLIKYVSELPSDNPEFSALKVFKVAWDPDSKAPPKRQTDDDIDF